MTTTASTGLRLVAIAVGVALLAPACTGPPAGAPGAAEEKRSGRRRGAGQTKEPGRGALELDLRPVVDGLTLPLFVTSAGDGTDRLFIVEQGGTIRVSSGGRLSPKPFLDVTDLTAPGGEQGLLGLAFHPRYEDNGRFFINYTDTAGDTVVAEYGAAPGAGAADPRSARTLLTIDQPYSNHNGGHVVFGPDGYLYIGTGDGGSAGDPEDNAQSPATLLGKLLRIDVGSSSGGLPYGIPEDNPFARRAEARPEIWSYGLRNPWRFSFDRATGDLWIGDVGQDNLEEIDHTSSTMPGLNFGWDDMEGSRCFEPPTGCEAEGAVLPVAEYSHDAGCSVTGGFVYRGSQFPALEGTYFFADYCSGAIYGIPAKGAAPDLVPRLSSGASVTSFGEDDNGELYVVDGAAGRVLQLTARP